MTEVMSEKMKKIIRILTLMIFVLPYAVKKTEIGENRTVTVKALLWEDEVEVRDGKWQSHIRFPYGKPNLMNRLSDRKDETV